METFAVTKSRIQERSARIGIVGLGYVGLPLILRFSEEKFSVVGLDIDEKKVKQLVNGKSYIEHIPDHAIAAMNERGASYSSDFSLASELDALIICVPTPLSKHREPDLSFIKATLESLAPHLKPGQILSLESTTYPGTTEEVLVAAITAKNLKVGEDFYVVYSPEREDPGRRDFTTQTTPKICGGVTPACLELGACLYESIVDKVVQVSSPRVAEMTKLLENIHRAVNIGLVNEMKIVADAMNIDIFEVIEAAATKPFGFVPYYPGPGIGGHCIPVDPFYLTWKAREYGHHTRFIELAGEVNSKMPGYVVDKITYALNKASKSVHGAKILVLGLAYKKNVDDVRESPSLEIIRQLEELGAQIAYSDPHVAHFPTTRRYQEKSLSSVDLTEANLRSYDCVVHVTDHDKFDVKLIAECSKILIDTRGVFPKHLSNVVRA